MSGSWTFNRKFIARDEINPKYREKVVFNRTSLSLCLKELTDADAGMYEVTFADTEFNAIEEKHIVIVQGRFYRLDNLLGCLDLHCLFTITLSYANKFFFSLQLPNCSV